ncbi:MAG: hypothetical protein JWQ71_1009 [Pedosphaera sp.]|nr:hypothetical protein [Pedosphaera sp.]
MLRSIHFSYITHALASIILPLFPKLLITIKFLLIPTITLFSRHMGASIFKLPALAGFNAGSFILRSDFFKNIWLIMMHNIGQLKTGT